MAFLKNYWWAILAIGGLALYTWRAVRRASEETAARSSLPGAPRAVLPQERVSEQPTQNLAAGLPVLLLAILSFVVREIARSYEVVRATTLDLVLVALIGIALAVVFARRAVHPDFGPDPRSQPPTRGATFVRSFIGMALGVMLGSGFLQIANGILDIEPSRRFAAVVAERRCGTKHSSLVVHGAPVLPGDASSIELEGCGGARLGDTVFLEVKPGFFGRPWVASRHLQTSEDRFRQQIEQRRRATP